MRVNVNHENHFFFPQISNEKVTKFIHFLSIIFRMKLMLLNDGKTSKIEFIAQIFFLS